MRNLDNILKVIFSVFLVLGFFSLSFAGDRLSQYFSFMGFTLEESTIHDVIGKLGETVIHKEGDAASSYTGVCYYSPENKVFIYFESGEMGGGDTILGYKVIKESKSRYPCKEVPGLSQESLKIGELELGEDIITAIKSLPDNIESKDYMSFHYLDKIPFTDEEIKRLQVQNSTDVFWYQSVTIQLFPDNNKVVGYGVYKVTSS